MASIRGKSLGVIVLDIYLIVSSLIVTWGKDVIMTVTTKMPHGKMVVRKGCLSGWCDVCVLRE